MCLAAHPCLPHNASRFWDTRAGKNTATVTTPGANLYLSWSPDSHYVAVANREDVVSIIDARSVGGGGAWWSPVPGGQRAAA